MSKKHKSRSRPRMDIQTMKRPKFPKRDEFKTCEGKYCNNLLLIDSSQTLCINCRNK